MLRLTKAFVDIALWRETPAHLPASLDTGLLLGGATIIEQQMLPPT